MPRINRNTVQFIGPDNRLWEATFSHQHNEETGIEHAVPKRNDRTHKRMLAVKHITTCKLRVVGTGLTYIGTSLCSMTDKYNWKYGIKWALVSALEKAGFCSILRSSFGVKMVEPADDSFGKMLASFYRELPIKAYPPHAVSVVQGEVVDIPAANLNGLYHAGAD
jgi:hypothetical protein